MTGPGHTDPLEQMRHDWDERARQNARHYVANGQEDWTDEEFFRSGEITLEDHVYSDLTNICRHRDPKSMRVLEIGCGAGRITRALARFFGEVDAVDISGEMVRLARQALQGYPNARVFQNNGKDLSVLNRGILQRLGFRRRRFDFAMSYIVFQHIGSRQVIESYVRAVNRVLMPGALFKFQVQGYPLDAGEIDASWLGVPFTEAEARAMADRCGFEMRYQFGAGEQDYWLWFFKARELR
jgi:SAM-dependent methyltransferase